MFPLRPSLFTGSSPASPGPVGHGPDVVVGRSPDLVHVRLIPRRYRRSALRGALRKSRRLSRDLRWSDDKHERLAKEEVPGGVAVEEPRSGVVGDEADVEPALVALEARNWCCRRCRRGGRERERERGRGRGREGERERGREEVEVSSRRAIERAAFKAVESIVFSPTASTPPPTSSSASASLRQPSRRTWACRPRRRRGRRMPFFRRQSWGRRDRHCRHSREAAKMEKKKGN